MAERMRVELESVRDTNILEQLKIEEIIFMDYENGINDHLTIICEGGNAKHRSGAVEEIKEFINYKNYKIPSKHLMNF